MSSTYKPPVFENTTEKSDALDWDSLPDERCDLNYRSLKARPAGIHWRTLGLLLLVPFVALPAILLLHRNGGSTFGVRSGFAASLLIGGVCVMLVDFGNRRV